MIVRTGFCFDPADWDVVSNDAKNFIRGLLRKNPRKRMTARKALRQPWLVNYTTSGRTVRNHLTINTELKRFRAQMHLVRAFGALRAFDRMRRLVDKTRDLKVAEDQDE